jgi:hypothetical protein
VLIERPGSGRAAFYGAVNFSGGGEVGAVSPMRLVGSDGRRLVGEPVE